MEQANSAWTKEIIFFPSNAVSPPVGPWSWICINSLSSPVSRARSPDSCASSLLVYHGALTLQRLFHHALSFLSPLSGRPWFSTCRCPVLFRDVGWDLVMGVSITCPRFLDAPECEVSLVSLSQERGLSTPSVSSIFLTIHLVSLVPTRTSPGHLCSLSKI